jgi:hypothetical protein
MSNTIITTASELLVDLRPQQQQILTGGSTTPVEENKVPAVPIIPRTTFVIPEIPISMSPIVPMTSEVQPQVESGKIDED